MGGCQNYDPFLGTLNIRCRILIGLQNGTIILTTTHMVISRVCFGVSLVNSNRPSLCMSGAQPVNNPPNVGKPTSRSFPVLSWVWGTEDLARLCLTSCLGTGLGVQDGGSRFGIQPFVQTFPCCRDLRIRWPESSDKCLRDPMP